MLVFTIIFCVISILLLHLSLNSTEIFKKRIEDCVIKITFSKIYTLKYLFLDILIIVLGIAVISYFLPASFWYYLSLVYGFIIIPYKIIINIISFNKENIIKIKLTENIVVVKDQKFDINRIDQIVLENLIGQGADDTNLYNMKIKYSNNRVFLISRFKSMEEMSQLYNILNDYLRVEGMVIIDRGVLGKKMKQLKNIKRN